jgi:hypothetical protein
VEWDIVTGNIYELSRRLLFGWRNVEAELRVYDWLAAW